jgi:SHS2 domain-containing protein
MRPLTAPPPMVSRDCFGVFDHDADIGIVGRGATLDEAFAAGASAMFDLQCRIEGIAPLHRVDLEFDETDLEFAFVAWLNGLLSLAHTQGLALGRFALTHVRDRWRGAGWGERWHAGLARGIDVKGATLTMLSVRETDGGWVARCIVDV